MDIGIIADTHDNIPATEAAVDRFESIGVDAIIHCGDFIAPPVIPYLDLPDTPVHAVRGNNDGEREGLRDAFEGLDSGTLHGRFADITIDERRFAVLHGESKPVIESLGRSDEYDYVVYGHWHVREERTIDGTTIINPGAHFPTVSEANRTVAVVETDTDTVEFHRIDDSP